MKPATFSAVSAALKKWNRQPGCLPVVFVADETRVVGVISVFGFLKPDSAEQETAALLADLALPEAAISRGVIGDQFYVVAIAKATAPEPR